MCDFQESSCLKRRSLTLLGLLFRTEGSMEQVIDRQIGAVMR